MIIEFDVSSIGRRGVDAKDRPSRGAGQPLPEQKMQARIGDHHMNRLRNERIIISSLVAVVVAWPELASAAPLPPDEAALVQLGKKVFFDKISKPEDQQACASCHDFKVGGTLPNSKINKTTVSAPGAKVKRRGSLKPPTNQYAFFSPPFVANGLSPGLFEGGNFWDGRAEGFGALGSPSGLGDVAVSGTVRLEHIPLSKQDAYKKYLGPTTDQALNPFPNNVEQNIRIKRVCKNVRDASYSSLYTQAYGVPIDCKGLETDPASPVSISYKRIALSLGAYQASDEVNSFSSKRDKALKIDPTFPVDGLTPQENLGHDLFYGRNDTGQNRIVTGPFGTGPLNANCAVCHSGLPGQSGPTTPPPFGNNADPEGDHPNQLYTDNFYHHIGLPYNREVRQTINGSNGETVLPGEKKGLTDHISTASFPGHFKTPTLRNVAKGATATFTKAYMHNGYFKNLEDVVHFYNTRDVAPNGKCETLGIQNATAAEAKANNCWPAPEFDNGGVAPGFIVGNLGLTPAEEAALVAYLKTLSDTVTPTAR
jgi:cytochrome c peroxidase